MCSWSSRRYGSVSARNAASSPARACARVCSVTPGSSQRRSASHASLVPTSRRMEIRRSLSPAPDASTPNTGERSSGDGTDRDEWPAERVARRSGAGPRRPGGLRARRLVRRVRRQGPRGVEPARARGGAPRRGVAARPREATSSSGRAGSPGRGELADRLNSMPKYVVSSTLDSTRVEQLDRPRGRRGEPRSRS